MKKHYKLFEVKDGIQVLYERGFEQGNEESPEDKETIITSCYKEGVKASLTGWFDVPEKADEAFESLTQETAQSWYDAITEMTS